MTVPQVRPVRKASRDMVRALGLLNLPSGDLSMTRCHTLIELEASGKLTVAALAQLLTVDKSTMSRTLARMEKEGLVKAQPNQTDKRQKPLVLTPAGREALAKIHEEADRQVNNALTLLSETERNTVMEGLLLYSKALARAQFRGSLVIRPVTQADNPAIAMIIRQVLTEYGANKPGVAFMDPEVDWIYETYQGENAAYFVVVRGDEILGGGGFSPLAGGNGQVCELQKMYFLPQIRGYGLGAEVIGRLLDEARVAGFRGCYLETLTSMERAQRLYRSFGFEKLTSPMGNTGHCGCDNWFYRDLDAPVTGKTLVALNA